MSTAHPIPGPRPQRIAAGLRTLPPWEIALGLVVLAAAGVLMARAFTDPTTFDVGLAYEGGKEALRSGHPEHLPTWISTPFLAMVMAGVSRVMSADTAALLASVLNVAVIVALVGAVWARLRPLMSRPLWWATLTLAVLYAPAISSLWWKQLNLIALGFAVLGYSLATRGRPGRAGLAVALSIAVKPLVVLLPFVLLAQRRTRRAGVLTIAWGLALLAVSQVFLALQAGRLSGLSPLPTLQAFSDRAKPANVWACHPENFAPGSTLCRLAGSDNWNYQRAAVLLFVAVVGFALFEALRGRTGGSWAVFATTCLLSPMISPIAWSHYQLLMAPMFVVLAFEMSRRRTPVGLWMLLGAAYVLAAMIWQPYGTSAGAIFHVLTGREQTQTMVNGQLAISEFGQYVLAMAALAWFSLTRAAGPQPPDAPIKP